MTNEPGPRVVAKPPRPNLPPRRPQPIRTQTELKQYVDRTGAIYLKGAWFNVRVLDARERFGDTDLLVSPVSGEGSYWTPLLYVKLDD